VLFSMGILLVGLMGVAAMIPAGRHEILQGTKVDHATSVGRAAFRDLKIREFMEPERWVDTTNTAVYQPSSPANPFNLASGPSPLPYVAIDPLGLTASTTFGQYFPYYNPGPPPGLYLTRIYPMPQPGNAADRFALADSIFRNADDLAFQPNTTLKDGSPEQMLFVSTGGTLPVSKAGGSGLKRLGTGDYSWLATIVPDPTATSLNAPMTVSVAVYYKRDLANPLTAETNTKAVFFPAGSPTVPSLGGGEVVLNNPAKPVKPGQWLMMAGANAAGQKFFNWYRVIAADVVTTTIPTGMTLPSGVTTIQSVTLAGADWSAIPAPGAALNLWPDVFLFDNIIAVYEKHMRLDFE